MNRFRNSFVIPTKASLQQIYPRALGVIRQKRESRLELYELNEILFMIEKIIDFSARNRFIIIVIYILVIGFGIWSVYNTPVDAIPDLSENQVIVWTEWMGRSPQIIEDQITYPLTKTLQGIPQVKAVRSQSMFGMSFIYVIFDDKADIYGARSRVLEKLNQVKDILPQNVSPVMGPDGTGVGHIYWYHLASNKYDLGELRALQDYYLKYQLTSVEGVAEVAYYWWVCKTISGRC